MSSVSSDRRSLTLTLLVIVAILSYLDRQLDPDTVLAFERHLSVCSECTRVVAAQRAVWKALDQWEPIAVSADFDERSFARLAPLVIEWVKINQEALNRFWWTGNDLMNDEVQAFIRQLTKV